MTNLSRNKGEWSEVYIFLKLLVDGRVYAADKDLRKIPTAFLNILKIIREEVTSKVYWYVPGALVKIFLNGVDTQKTCTLKDLTEQKDFLWREINKHHVSASFTIPSVESFLHTIFVTKPSAPSAAKGNQFGGAVDITMETLDYKTGLSNVVGFSCKSDLTAKSSLFNASGDNTNFVYRVEGVVNDEMMSRFNAIFGRTKKNGERAIAIGDRIRFLKESGCSLHFEKPSQETAETNLVMSGGLELPTIIGEALRYYYFVNEGKSSSCSIEGAINNLVSTNPVGYKKLIRETYEKRLSDLLYNMFTGMKLKTPWDGKRTVNGGYIVVLGNGDVLAYHSSMEEEFREFLLSRLGFDSPSCSRHHYMQMYKEDGQYKLKLNLHIRFIPPQKEKQV